MTDVIAIFDIGKTNKKLILFNEKLQPLYQQEQKFPETIDEDGYPCDDIDKIREWMFTSIEQISEQKKYSIKALNFSTYGATIVYLDEKGKTLGKVYNYLKTMPEGIAEPIYETYGGIQEFCRRTASPASGFLNAGMQIIWLKKSKPEIFRKVKDILLFPQYWSYLFTGKIIADYTYIGCHTSLWDFDTMSYHPWLKDEMIHMPDPQKNDSTFKALNEDYDFRVGTGIHDSSASIVPYILKSKEKFILISTGTWSINMNPFNHEPLTKEQLDNECLCFLSINQKPVKSSRLFMGYIHDVNLERLVSYFKVDKNYYKKLRPNEQLIQKLSSESNSFFLKGVPDDYIDREADISEFGTFEEAYHRLIIDLANLNEKAIRQILPEKNDIRNIYISGGFSKNEIFVSCLARKFKNHRIFTSEFENSSAMGAALMVFKELGVGDQPEIDLGLKEWKV